MCCIRLHFYMVMNSAVLIYLTAKLFNAPNRCLECFNRFAGLHEKNCWPFLPLRFRTFGLASGQNRLKKKQSGVRKSAVDHLESRLHCPCCGQLSCVSLLIQGSRLHIFAPCHVITCFTETQNSMHAGDKDELQKVPVESVNLN